MKKGREHRANFPEKVIFQLQRPPRNCCRARRSEAVLPVPDRSPTGFPAAAAGEDEPFAFGTGCRLRFFPGFRETFVSGIPTVVALSSPRGNGPYLPVDLELSFPRDERRPEKASTKGYLRAA